MRIMKLVIVCVLASASFAYADPELSAPASSSNNSTWARDGVTVEMLGGFGFRNMREDSVLSAEAKYQNITLDPDVLTHWNNGEISWAAGFDIAYPISPLFSAEGGLMSLGDQRFHVDSDNGEATTAKAFCIDSGHCFKTGSSINFSSWFLYGALRADWKVVPKWTATAKLALLYMMTDIKLQRVTDSSTVNDSATASHWAPALALGVNYRFAKRWQVSTTYWIALLPSSMNEDHLFTHRDFSTFDKINMPVWQALLFGVGYEFSL